MTALDNLAQELIAQDHEEEAEAFRLVDYYMRRWGFTSEPLNAYAAHVQHLIQQVAQDWRKL